MKAFVKKMRSPRLSFLQTTASLFMAGFALLSSFWCEGKQKVPKPLCSPVKHQNCIPVPGVANATNIQFSWETGDDRFVFPTFHTGLFLICEENIYKDAWEEKCRGFYTLTPGSEIALHPDLLPVHAALRTATQRLRCSLHAGVSTLNNYTKTVLMVGPRRTSSLNACSFNLWALRLPASSSSLHSFPPPPSHLASASSIHRLSLPSQTPSYPPSVSPRLPLPGHQETRYDPGEDYSPL
ncbi:hypothetical protein F7725_003869 [Dissostichus mawsoni]|uniref:Uncharacterized protein n=1 Tax=Dissostichus mawsoni TaxID=36200 RepID=A0A7J5YCS3_DISMA|nr:hypothetical protein F7725_003869 [Dissostichus mawsoni]